ncbi:MAG: hypothetical protein WBZ24_16665 [Anaerolineales bacterium]
MELAHLLGEYRDDMVLVGGWVPELLLDAKGMPHVGSTDVDLALDHQSLEQPGYESILALLVDRGYQRSEEQPFIFYRVVRVEGRDITVEVDFLAGEYGGTGKRRRTQVFEDMRARKARGCDLAFDMNADVQLDGVLPDGGKDKATIRVASIVPFLVMKGMALESRLKEKDAWDIYYCVRNFPGGVDALIEQFRPHIGHGLVHEGLAKIADKFGSPEHMGPKFVADFEEIDDSEERDLLQRDAYERIDYLLRKLGLRQD